MRENFNKISQGMRLKSYNTYDIVCDKWCRIAESEGPSEDGTTDELVPGKSVVLAILEVIFCLLMQKIPVLNVNVSGFHLKPTGTAEENDQLMAETLKCLELLPDICTDDG